jgi:dTDP-4-amino-4,6-dideoxygalactose transaminase
MKKIAWADPKAEYLELQNEINGAILSVLESGYYILGPEVEAFEAEFAEYVGVRYALGVASGTEAIQLALAACGVSTNDEVITVSHTAVATVAAIQAVGANPVLVDIDPDSYTIATAQIEQVITTRTKAIIPVHIYGHPADLGPILEIAQKHHLFVVEDCAQSHGAVYKGGRTGSLGDVGAFSFYPTKNLGAIGDGGMIVTNNEAIFKKASLLRQYGWEKRYISQIAGYNSRLDPIQAAILRIKLRNLEENNQKRANLARFYSHELSNWVDTPVEKPDCSHVYHLYVIRTDHRDSLQVFLDRNGVSSGVHYPLPVHLQPAYKDKVLTSGSLSHTESIYLRIISLPLYPQLTKAQAQIVVDQVKAFFTIAR